MAILAGNITSKMFFGLQFRVFSIPWVKRNAGMLCLKGRDYNCSSVPVRYIPNKSSKINEPENSSPMKGFEKRVFGRSMDGAKTFGVNEKAQNRKQICKLDDSALQGLLVEKNVQNIATFSELEEIDNDVGTIDHALMEEPEEVIEDIGTQQEENIYKQGMRISKSLQDAEKMAIDLLATRAFTAVELRKKLHGKRFPSDIVEALITDFQSRGLINDSLYAETFSRSRWCSLSWGPRRIKQALFKKGVSEVDAEKAVKLVFEDSVSGDQESKFGLSKHSMDDLLVQVSKQWVRGQDLTKEKRKTRIVRWLQYRGFSWGIISYVLKKLESQSLR